MVCNVCGVEGRCYQLREVIENPAMVRNGEGMIFRICPDCLAKLIAGIKTDATKVEQVADIALPERVAATVAVSATRRDARLDALKGGGVVIP
jgi:hypothetical protein